MYIVIFFHLKNLSTSQLFAVTTHFIARILMLDYKLQQDEDRDIRFMAVFSVLSIVPDQGSRQVFVE